MLRCERVEFVVSLSSVTAFLEDSWGNSSLVEYVPSVSETLGFLLLKQERGKCCALIKQRVGLAHKHSSNIGLTEGLSCCPPIHQQVLM